MYENIYVDFAYSRPLLFIIWIGRGNGGTIGQKGGSEKENGETDNLYRFAQGRTGKEEGSSKVARREA